MQKVQEVLSSVLGGAAGTQLPTAKLGKNGPSVTRMGYGTMGLVSVFHIATRCRCRRSSQVEGV